MKTKHTPGPWSVRHNDEEGHFTVGAEGGASVICDGAGWYGEHNTSVANGKLIAAAPEIFEALRRLLNCPDLNLDELESETIRAIIQAHGAIDKATE